jgi:mRNA interferase RelE/StbE
MDMQVKATPRFIKSLDKLDATIRRRILGKAGKLADDPYEGKTLKGELSGLFSLRVGDYRIIYWVDEKENTVWLVDVGHRKRIYTRV